MAVMTVYHGGYQAVEKPEIRVGRNIKALKCLKYRGCEVYKRLIKQVAQSENIDIIDALIKIYNSFISPKIGDYNSSVYYENHSYLFESYREGKVL